MSAAEIAEAIKNSCLFHVDSASVEKSMTAMMTLGSYYRNLENALGQGATLALGTEIAETT